MQQQLKAQMRHSLDARGWFHCNDIDEDNFSEALSELGKEIGRTEVRPRPESRALVTSLRALDFHTDHHKADYVAWLCLRADKTGGGQSVLVNAENAFSQLDSNTRRHLGQIMLREHKIFPDDPESFPLVSTRQNRHKFYYSFWLVKDDMSPPLQEALQKFRQALAKSPTVKISLRTRDMLVVDNNTIFHGRRAICDENRHLERRWIAAYSQQPKEHNHANDNRT